MRKAVQKHYKSLAPFVTLANLGWDEILRRDGFPSLHELKPDGAHGALLRRISHAFSSNFRALQTCTEIPPLFFLRIGQVARRRYGASCTITRWCGGFSIVFGS